MLKEVDAASLIDCLSDVLIIHYFLIWHLINSDNFDMRIKFWDELIISVQKQETINNKTESR